MKEPDAFCRFLMSRGVIANRPKVVLLFHFLLRARGDVAAAFPNSQNDSDDRGFRDWINTSGVREYKFQGLFAFEDKDAVADHVGDLFRRLRSSGLESIDKKSRTIWSDPKSFDDLAAWLATQGTKQLRISRTHSTLLKQAIPAVGRILNVYFLRGDLQVRFPMLWTDAQIDELAGWLNENRYDLQLVPAEISLFCEFAKASRTLIETMRFLYLHKGAKSKASPNIYSVDQRRSEIGSALTTGAGPGFPVREQAF